MKSKRWKLISSALALSIFLTLSPVSVQAAWRSDSKGYWWNEGSSYAKSTWKKIGSQWYYFGSDGYMVTGWKKLGSVWYYFNAKGQMQTGWQLITGQWYYFNSKGHMLTGWQKIDSTWYYFKNNGEMQTGWQKISGQWYYFNSNGHMLTGWQKIGSAWYYFNSKGYMQSGWQKISGSWYYFYSNGKMAENTWINNTYYVNSSGKMLTNTTTPDGYTVGSNGKWDGKASTYSLFNTYSYFFHGYANAYYSITFKADGTFSGAYTVYPEGNPTGKISEYYGKISAPIKVNEYTYKIKVDSIYDKGTVGEIVIKNGSRYKRINREFFSNPTYLYLYLPGCPTSEIQNFKTIGFQSGDSFPNQHLAPDTAAIVSINDGSGGACVIDK